MAADNNDKQARKQQAQASRDLREAGRVPRWRNFHLDAGRRVRTAWAWIPRLRALVLVSCAVSMVAMLASIAAVYTRPPAMVFLSLPDGTIACAPQGTPTGALARRPPRQQAVCDRLRPPVGTGQALEPAPATASPTGGP